MIVTSVAGLNVTQERKNIARKAYSDFCLGHYVPLDVNLVPEPDNKFDPKAIKVMYGKDQLGYIPKKDQCILSEEHFKKVTPARAWDVGHNNDQDFYWCNIELT